MRLDWFDLSFGWREGLLGLIALLAVYMVFVLLRMRRLGRQKAAQPYVPAPLEPSVGPAAIAEAAEADIPADQLTYTIERKAVAEPQAAAPVAELEEQLAQMREELDALRGEVAALREDWHQETAQLRASQSVSPLYSEAMQMAMAGHGAEVIAERCGISRAEADLVIALSKQQEH